MGARRSPTRASPRPAFPRNSAAATIRREVAAFETLALGDLSLLIKFGVQFGLWGGASSSSGRAATTSAT